MSPADGKRGGGVRKGTPERRSAYEVLAVASRALLLEQVRGHPEGVNTATLARLTGLHPNTVRFHLDVLTEAGIVTVFNDPARKPGRPRLLFAAVHHAPPTGIPGGLHSTSQDGYMLLAAVLIQHLARISEDPAAIAEAAGRIWATDRTAQDGADRDGADQSPSDTRAVAEVTALFDELGFAPETVHEPQGWRILLHRCPFHALAAEHPEIVCRLHLGLLQGAVNRLGRPSETVRLQPFIAPGLCAAFLPLTDLRRR